MREHFDTKGYLVAEEYSSYEEYEPAELPKPIKKEAVKKTQLNLTQGAGSKASHAAVEGKPIAKTQASLSSFFKK